MHGVAIPVAQGVSSVVACSRIKGGDLCHRGCSIYSVGKAPQQKQVEFTEAFPTKQAVRQKEERKAREAALVELGLILAEV